MGKIAVMDQILANKIAAGEVVEKCVSIVKELVENSIDAGSTNIKVELVESGVKEIKVTDDGIGMDKEDAEKAFLPHATSKLLHEEDLYRIHTLGFRGEALPSIASVSDITLKTSTGEIGTCIHIKGGKTISVENGDSRRGTMVSVKNIFYNTPARLKHLNSLYTELANIIDYINKIALSHSDIAFTLMNDGKLLFKTDGSGKQLKVIHEIYGLDVVKKMMELSTDSDDYHVEGYISYPEVAKSSRNHIITLVNGRVVKNMELNRGMIDAYYTYIPDDRYPICIINISVDPSLVDVNIHPTKLDIKFSKLNELKELIQEEIKHVLEKNRLIQTVSIQPKETVATNYEQPMMDLKLEIHESQNLEPFHEEVEPKERIPMMYPVGLVKGTYIVAQNEEAMYMIDQHAAKERINYEYYLKVLNKQGESVSLLFPITITLPLQEYIVMKENMELLESMKFEVEDFGNNTILIRSHPTWLKKGQEEESIRKIIDLVIMKEKNFNLERFNDKIAITLSCKMSIKANENISLNEMENLISDLRMCDNPYTCPHGRPTVISYSNYELERLFKRAM